MTGELVASLKAKSNGLKVFAEFNTMHEASYLKDHPDARPIGADGQVSPPPDGWQGVCPTHPGYRRDRMDAFRQTLRTAPDRWHLARLSPCPRELGTGRAQPARYLFLRPLPVAVSARRRESSLPDGPTAERARRLLGSHKAGLGAVAVRRLHRLGPRVPRDPRPRNGPALSWELSIALGRTRTTTTRSAKSWPST